MRLSSTPAVVDDDVAVVAAVVVVSCGGWTLLLLLDLVMVTSAQFQNLVKKEGVERERGNELLIICATTATRRMAIQTSCS